jgi:hypothetical protein
LRVGGGVQGFLVAQNAAGFAFANVTVGTSDEHLTINGGGAFDFTNQTLGAGLVTVSGNKRLGPTASLIGETWIFYFPQGAGPWGGPFFVVPSGGVRLFGPQFAIDLGLVPIITGESGTPVIPLPWVSFAWNWSTRG